MPLVKMTTAQVLRPTPIHTLPASTKASGVMKVTSALASWMHAHTHNIHHAVPPSGSDDSRVVSGVGGGSTDELLNHTTYTCKRCSRPFTLHIHRPSGLFYRDKCNYYHPGRLMSTREVLDRYKGKEARQQELRAKLGLDLDDGSSQFWSCCLRKEDGHPHAYGGCSFNGNKHVVD